MGSTNVDYQRQLEVSIWWMGFFDRETDILFYHLSVGSECRNNSYFTYPVVAQVGGAAGGGRGCSGPGRRAAGGGRGCSGPGRRAAGDGRGCSGPGRRDYWWWEGL